MKKIKVLLAFFIIFQVIFSTSIVSAASNDISGHWAEATIKKWLEQGTIGGYEDGSFKPNQAMTRAEFIKILNHTFDVEQSTQQNINFSDLSTNHWAYDEIVKAINHGYVSGTSEHTFSPNAAIKRQEAAAMVAHLLNLERISEVAFKDADQIASWSKIAVATLASKGILLGDQNGNFRPLDSLSRAEAVTLIDKAKVETVFNEAGTYGNEQQLTVIEGDVRISASGVKLLNTKITGSLTVDKAVGEGDVYLTKVEVVGETIVQGGGVNSIHLEDSVLIRIIADKETGKVRIVAIGSTTVQEVFVRSAIKLEESQTSGSGFNNVELSSALPAGSNVDLVGHFESVSVLASNIKVNIPSGSINELTVEEQANDTAITLAKEAKVLSLMLNIAAQLLGEGTIEKAVIGERAGESNFATAPKVLDGEGAPLVVLPPSTLPPATPPSSGGGPTPTPTPTPNPGTGSSDATLHDVKITSDVNFEWKKSRLSKTVTDSVYGFDSSHLEYITVIPSGAANYEVTFNIEHDAGARVHAYSREEGISSVPVTNITNGIYSTSVKSNSETVVTIGITSENGVSHKYYSFYFVPEAINIQQDFQLLGSGSYYYIQSQNLLIGDVVKVIVPASLSNLNEELEFEFTVEGAYHNGTKAYFSGGLSKYGTKYEAFVANDLIGTIQIEITREGKIVSSSPYYYDLIPFAIKSIDDAAYGLTFKTTAELTLSDAQSFYTDKHESQYTITLNQDEIERLYGPFEYYSVNFYFGDVGQTTVEQLKSINFRDYNNKTSMAQFERTYGHVYDPSNADADGIYYTTRTHTELLLTLYDSNKKPIEAISISKPIPETALGQHVKFKNKLN